MKSARCASIRLRQTVGDFHPRRFRSDVNVPRRFHPRVAVQSSRTEAQVLGIFILAFEYWRATPAAKHPMITRRRFPLLEQLFAADKAERCCGNSRAARKCRAGHLAAQTAMTMGHG